MVNWGFKLLSGHEQTGHYMNLRQNIQSYCDKICSQQIYMSHVIFPHQNKYLKLSPNLFEIQMN